MPMLKAKAPSLDDADKWLNSEPKTLDKGINILYFWNFGCKCCRDRMRIFKHIQDRYASVDVIGVHTPNFDFEKEEAACIAPGVLGEPLWHGRCSQERAHAYGPGP